MNDLELREHFEEWAEPLRAASPPGLAVLRRRIRRRRAKMAAAAGSALAVTGIVAGLLASGTITAAGGLEPRPATGRHGPAPHFSYRIGVTSGPFETGPYPAPIGAPYLLMNAANRTPPTLIDTLTGDPVLAPRPAANTVGFSAMAAAPDDSLFIVGQQSSVGLRTSFVEIQVTDTSARQMPALPGVLLPVGTGIYGMSVNPAGTRLAMNVVPRDGVGATHLEIYDVATGARVDDFSEGPGGSVTLQYWPTADQLAFSYRAGSGTTGNGLRILDAATAARPGTTLLTDSTLDAAVHGYALGTFSSDGTVVMNKVQVGKLMVLKQWSAASGQLLNSVAIGTATANNKGPYYCGVLWASADGTALLTQCGTRQLEIVNGLATPAKLAVNVLASELGGYDSFAW